MSINILNCILINFLHFLLILISLGWKISTFPRLKKLIELNKHKLKYILFFLLFENLNKILFHNTDNKIFVGIYLVIISIFFICKIKFYQNLVKETKREIRV